jgi:hypothetical protein
MVRVLSKYIQEKYISDGGRKRERSGPAVQGFRK